MWSATSACCRFAGIRHLILRLNSRPARPCTTPGFPPLARPLQNHVIPALPRHSGESRNPPPPFEAQKTKIRDASKRSPKRQTTTGVCGWGRRVSPARGGNVRRTKGDRGTTDTNDTPSRNAHHSKMAIVTPFPPAFRGAGSNVSTCGSRDKISRTACRRAPVPSPWMMRTLVNPCIKARSMNCGNHRFDNVDAGTPDIEIARGIGDRTHSRRA